MTDARRIAKGSELLLAPDDALGYIDELEQLGIVILGADGWYTVDRAKGWIAQDLDADFSVPDDLLRRSDASAASAAAVREFISSRLTARVEFVSLTLAA